MSPLERRALLALISLIRDREDDEEFWITTDVPLSKLYDRLYVIQPDRSWEIQRKYQRQAIRRALGRLHPELVTAYALAWVNIEDQAVIRWQGGGTRKRGETYPTAAGGAYTHYEDTPRWRLVGLSADGIALAQALERESAA